MGLEAVAERAGVSIATVSRVVNNSTAVNAKTRARVLKAIKELRYHPNLHARTLAGGKSNTIGVIVSNLENPFFFDVYKAVEEDAHERGYEVLVANTDYNSEQLSTCIRLMMQRRVAGLAVIVSEMNPALIDELSAENIPIVFYDVGSPRRNITNIRVSYRHGIQRLVEYLRSLGHQKLGFVGHHSTLGPIHERLKAVKDIVSEYGASMEIRPAAGKDSLEGGRHAASALFATGYRPTAVVCVNDIMAVGVLRALRQIGMRVPEDVSVTGFDNIKISEFCSPALTTLHIARDEIGHIVCESLTRPDHHAQSTEREVILYPELVVRDSTARAVQLTSANSDRAPNAKKHFQSVESRGKRRP